MKGFFESTARPKGPAAVLLFVFVVASLVFPLCEVSASAIDLALIEPATLKGNEQSWAILDARPVSDWQASHIPGAASLSWENYTRTDNKGVPYRVRPPEEMAATLEKMGITETSPVVVYGDADKSWGGEGWVCWVFAWLGHTGPVRLMSGGIQAWRAQGCPVSQGREPEKPKGASVHYQVRLNPELDVLASELERSNKTSTIIDTRSTLEWLRGHIPGAVHIPWTDFYTGKERRPISSEALKKLLRDHGITSGDSVVYYCAGGIRSGYCWTVHELCGLSSARNYEGGMEEWKRRAPKQALSE